MMWARRRVAPAVERRARAALYPSLHHALRTSAAALSYILWGLFPLYIKQLQAVPTLEIVLHRSAWPLVFVFSLLALLKRSAWLAAVLRQPRTPAIFGLSALLLAGNWLLYVWAVNAGRLLDASLGYFINPLVNVVLGYAALHERPRPLHPTYVKPSPAPTGPAHGGVQCRTRPPGHASP